MIVNFDENDGQFEHVPPPVPAAGTTDEFYLETSLAPEPLPVGLGFRVPLLLISPWTRGGWVNGGLRSHLGAPVPGEVDGSARHAGDLPEHQRLAPQRLR